LDDAEIINKFKKTYKNRYQNIKKNMDKGVIG
jgi:hypothetical protein